MDRDLITPGKLYARLSAEFHARRAECRDCRMPMVVARRTNGDGSANWTVEKPSRPCEACGTLIQDIVRTHAERFDIFDPTSVAFHRRPGANPFRPSAGK